MKTEEKTLEDQSNVSNNTNNKTEVDNGAGKPFRSQRDNKEKPSSACNVTSIIIALCAAGYPVDTFAPKGEQPEDELMRFIYSDPATLKRWEQIDPKKDIPPNQWHGVLAYGAGRFLKTFGYDPAAVVFKTDVTVAEIVAAVNSGGTAVVSGQFSQNGKPLHHIVAVVGYGEDKDGCGTIENELKEFTWSHVVNCPQKLCEPPYCEGDNKSKNQWQIFGKNYESTCHSPLAFFGPDENALNNMKKLLHMTK